MHSKIHGGRTLSNDLEQAPDHPQNDRLSAGAAARADTTPLVRSTFLRLWTAGLVLDLSPTLRTRPSES